MNSHEMTEPIELASICPSCGKTDKAEWSEGCACLLDDVPNMRFGTVAVPFGVSKKFNGVFQRLLQLPHPQRQRLTVPVVRAAF